MTLSNEQIDEYVSDLSCTPMDISDADRDALLAICAQAKQANAPTSAQPVAWTAWLLERKSTWGCEWFCSGERDSRWTKKAHKAILFPSKDAVAEAHARFRGITDKVFSYPLVEDGASGEWEYTYSITEHMFNCGISDATPPALSDDRIKEIAVNAALSISLNSVRAQDAYIIERAIREALAAQKEGK